MQASRLSCATAFIAWAEYGDPTIRVRIFNELIERYLYETSGYSAIGMNNWGGFAVLEVDGSFARAEEFDEPAFAGLDLYRTNTNVHSSSWEEVEAAVDLRSTTVDHTQIADQCRACEVNNICNGGNIASRLGSDGSFNHSGVHCGTLMMLSKMIHTIYRELEHTNANHNLNTNAQNGDEQLTSG